jgi:hypothetical protein
VDKNIKVAIMQPQTHLSFQFHGRLVHAQVVGQDFFCCFTPQNRSFSNFATYHEEKHHVCSTVVMPPQLDADCLGCRSDGAGKPINVS